MWKFEVDTSESNWFHRRPLKILRGHSRPTAECRMMTLWRIVGIRIRAWFFIVIVVTHIGDAGGPIWSDNAQAQAQCSASLTEWRSIARKGTWLKFDSTNTPLQMEITDEIHHCIFLRVHKNLFLPLLLRKTSAVMRADFGCHEASVSCNKRPKTWLKRPSQMFSVHKLQALCWPWKTHPRCWQHCECCHLARPSHHSVVSFVNTSRSAQNQIMSRGE